MSSTLKIAILGILLKMQSPWLLAKCPSHPLNANMIQILILMLMNLDPSLHFHFPKIHPKSLHSSNPLQAPPARLLTSASPPCWLAGWQRVGGPPSLYPLIPSPPPVLHSFHSHPSHLIPSVHQNCSLKVFDVNSFCHLSVQAACV